MTCGIIWVAIAAACAARGADTGEITRSVDDCRLHDLPHTDTVFQPTRYASLAEWKARRQWLRDQVRFAAGLHPEPERTPLNTRIFGKLERDGYTIEKVYFESLPGFYVMGNLYRPLGASGKRPGVACPHGHWPGGRVHHDERGSIPARCIMLARLGAVAFAYDMIGFNDSKRQIDHRDPQLNSRRSSLWGLSSLALQTWNSIRVLDFLQSLPDVDPDRIGVTGASGGGTQTFILSAVDDRVQVAVPVNMISSTMQGGCICENAPLLRIDTNNMEIAALFAPKPMLMVSATGDWTKNTPTVEYPMVRSIYELYGAADRVANVHIDAEHNYNQASREAMYRFFGEWLLNREDADHITEGDLQVDTPETLAVFSEDNLPADMITVDELIEWWKAAARDQIGTLRPGDRTHLDRLADLVRAGLKHAVGTSFPAEGDVQVMKWPAGRPEGDARYRLLWTGIRDGRCVRCLVLAPKNLVEAGTQMSTVVCVTPDGLAAVEKADLFVSQLLDANYRVVFVEPFGTGDAKRSLPASRPKSFDKYFTTFNRTDVAEAVFDILTVLGFYTREAADRSTPAAPPDVTVVGVGRMGPLCLVARALVPDAAAERAKLRTVIDMNGFDADADQAYLDSLYLPGIQRIGGLRAVFAVAAASPVWFHNTADRFDVAWARTASETRGVRIRFDAQRVDWNDMVEWVRDGN